MLKKVFKDKRAILVVSILALFSLVVLASAINNVAFRPPRHLSREEAEVIRVPVGELVQSLANIPLEKEIALLVMLLLFGVLVVALLPPELRKKLLKELLRVALGILLLLYLLKLKPDLLQGLFSIFNQEMHKSAPTPAAEGVPPPTFEPPHVSGWLSFFVALCILLFLVFLFRRIYRWWHVRREAFNSLTPLDEIAEIARASLRDLSSRNGLAQDKIVQCYADMSRVVGARRGLHREYAMTASEFAARLEKAGLPREPVNRLTHLFESVRYGARISVQRDVDEAVTCLTSILKYCGDGA
jgi:hypothetical protein